MMIGGPKQAVDRLDPIFAALAPGLGDIPRTPGRAKGDTRAERGYIHAGPSGAGHFVKMVHNGIEYGLMQAYAEGFDILRNKDSKDLPEERAIHIEPAGYRRSLAARQCHLVLAARPRRRRAGEGPAVEEFLRLRPGFRRGSLDRRGRDRGGGPGRRALQRRSTPDSAHGRSTHSAKRCSRPCVSASAGTSRVKNLSTPNQSRKNRRVTRPHRMSRSSAMLDKQFADYSDRAGGRVAAAVPAKPSRFLRDGDLRCQR